MQNVLEAHLQFTPEEWQELQSPEDANRMGYVIAVFPAVLLNGYAWRWAIIAGFRHSGLWGAMNRLLYPVAPLIYGFFIREDIGRNAAIMVLFSVATLIIAIGALRDASEISFRFHTGKKLHTGTKRQPLEFRLQAVERPALPAVQSHENRLKAGLQRNRSTIREVVSDAFLSSVV